MSPAAHLASLLVASLVMACSAAVPPTREAAPAASASVAPQEGDEVATDGNSSVTVLSRPDHPLAHKPAAAAAKPMTNSECRAQPACATTGLCTASGTSCVSASWEDCLQMKACARGRCLFEAGECRPVATCREAHGCKHLGLCGDEADRCVAVDEDGCRQSVACRDDGLCSLADGLCVAKAPKDCQGAAICKSGARCVPLDGLCRATDDGQCRRSPACKDEGRCLARDGECVKSCEESSLCRRFGRCKEKKEAGKLTCAAAADPLCEASSICAELGHCSAGLDGRCQAGDDVECLRSLACKEDGRCRAQRGRCLPSSDAECKQAVVACGREGRCRHEQGRCVK